MDRALVVSYRNIVLILRFWRENNFFAFVLFFSLAFLLELPHTTTTKVTPASKNPMKIKVYKVVPKQISDFTQIYSSLKNLLMIILVSSSRGTKHH